MNKNKSNSKVGRKNGMFDHAKYSQPVLRLISDSMLQAVRNDVTALLDQSAAATRAHKRGHPQQDDEHRRRHQAANDVAIGEQMSSAKKRRLVALSSARREEAEHPKRQHIGASSAATALWDHNKLRQQNGIDVLATSFRPASLVAATLGPLRKGGPFFPPEPTFSQVRDALTAVARRDLPGGKERTLLPPLLMQRYRHDNQRQLSSPSSPTLEDTQQENFKRIDQLLATTPERKRPNQPNINNNTVGRGTDDHDADEELFPEKPPMLKIAAKLLESQPGITLRPNEPTTMSDAAFSLVRRKLFAARERYKEQTDDGQMPPSKSSSGLDGTDRDGPEKNPFSALLDQTMLFDQEQNDQQHINNMHNRADAAPDNDTSTARGGHGIGAGEWLEESPYAYEDYLGGLARGRGAGRQQQQDVFGTNSTRSSWFSSQQRDGTTNNCAPTLSGFECSSSSAYNYRQSLVGDDDDDEEGNFLAGTPTMARRENASSPFPPPLQMPINDTNYGTVRSYSPSVDIFATHQQNGTSPQTPMPLFDAAPGTGTAANANGDAFSVAGLEEREGDGAFTFF